MLTKICDFCGCEITADNNEYSLEYSQAIRNPNKDNGCTWTRFDFCKNCGSKVKTAVERIHQEIREQMNESVCRRNDSKII